MFGILILRKVWYTFKLRECVKSIVVWQFWSEPIVTYESKIAIARRTWLFAMPDLQKLTGQSELASTQELLTAAIDHWDNTPVSAQYIQAALAKHAGLDVLISAYRYYFYKSDAANALEMAIAVCERVQQAEHWPTEWDRLKPMLLAQIESPNARLYVNAYAASAMLKARLGDLETAQIMAEQVKELQAKEFGADVLLGILNPPPDDDED